MTPSKAPESVPEWLADMGAAVQSIGHATGWAEAVHASSGIPSLAFAFFTLDPAKARLAMQLLGAAGLLCETATRADTGLDSMEPFADIYVAAPVTSVVDGLRALAGTVRQ